jgi:hypothetical protein
LILSLAVSAIAFLSGNAGLSISITFIADRLNTVNPKKSLESRKATQGIDASDKIKNTLFTNQVTTVFFISPCTSIPYASFSRSSDFSRFKIAQPSVDQFARVTRCFKSRLAVFFE